MARAKQSSCIRLRGARQNNLKDIDLDLPLNRFIVVTGVSGSGKSSLAFETLFAEGQRRYIETFSPYARQFFDRMDKPQVKAIEGIPPAIAIEQRNTVRTTRSTVGTMTEICDYMKLLWPHLAQLHCRGCGRPVIKEPPQQVWAAMPREGEALVLFELPLSEKLSLEESLGLTIRQGYQRLRVGNEVVRVEEALPLMEPLRPKSFSVVQDRIRLQPRARQRFLEACEQAYHFGHGRLTVHWTPPEGASRDLRFSQWRHCAECDLEYAEPTSALFSFNHPLGACPECRGFGRIITIDYRRAIPDETRTLGQGVVKPWLTGQGLECQRDLLKFCRKRGVRTDVPFAALSAEQRRWVIDGDAGYGKDAEHEWPRAWYGVRGYFRWLESRAYKMHVRVLLSRYRAYSTCPQCEGRRLKPDSLLYRLSTAGAGGGKKTTPCPVPEEWVGCGASFDLAAFYRLPVRHAVSLVNWLAEGRAEGLGDPVRVALHEVRDRLQFLNEVGLGYLTLDRPTRSLSGGETERVNLTSCLGTRLVNTLYVLDEPSVGLHVRDTSRLVRIIKALRDLGNTVVVVEHEADVILAADHIVDLGPGQGERGGEVIFAGSVKQLMRSKASLTAACLRGRQRGASTPARAVTKRGVPWLSVSHVNRHNLRDLTVSLPLQRFVCVTGVSGSGKTTLVREVIHPRLESLLGDSADGEGEQDSMAELDPASTSARLKGWQALGRVVMVDQSAVSRTPRSTPAVFIGAFDDIRQLLAKTEMAKQKGLNASAFSFNAQQGQCERCRGVGFEKIEMQFLSDVFVRCADCDGRRYREHILEVKVARGNPTESAKQKEAPTSTAWSVADFLQATVDEAVGFLDTLGEDRAATRARDSLHQLQSVGLGYVRLGQPLNTLSGGENQRLKLAAHLSQFLRAEQRQAKPTLFIFDEPTTGLHFADIEVLLGVFQQLVDAGHSLLVVEHNLDVIRAADWLVDLGPEAGEEGGRVVVEGAPKLVSRNQQSHTGRALARMGVGGNGSRTAGNGGWS